MPRSALSEIASELRVRTIPRSPRPWMVNGHIGESRPSPLWAGKKHVLMRLRMLGLRSISFPADAPFLFSGSCQ